MNKNTIQSLIEAAVARSLRMTPSDANALGLMSRTEARRELEASRLVKPAKAKATRATAPLAKEALQ